MDINIKDQLVNVDPERHQLIINSFAPAVERLTELAKEFPAIRAMEDGEEKSAKAKRFRIDFGKAVTLADKVRASLKEKPLKEGQGIQGIYNHIKQVTSEMKEEAIAYEKYIERIEAEKIEKLEAERLKELGQYEMDGTNLQLGQMENAVWQTLHFGAKAKYDAEIEAEKKAEAEGIENKRIQDLHNARAQEIREYWNYIPEGYDKNFFGNYSEDEFDCLMVTVIDLADKDFKEKEKIRQDNEKLRLKGIEDQKEIDRLKKQKDEKAKKEREKKKAEADEAKRIANAPDKEKLYNVRQVIEQAYYDVEGKEVKEFLLNLSESITNYARIL